jgi:hypothetical protein
MGADNGDEIVCTVFVTDGEEPLPFPSRGG